MTPPTISPARPEVVTREAPRDRYAWVQNMTATDHKQVGVLYICTALVALVLAVTLLVLMRAQLIVPENTFLSPDIFDQLMSLYGATAVVFFALPLAIGLATYVLPLQIGARGVAFPRLGAASYWLYVLGGIILFATFLYEPPEGGHAGPAAALLGASSCSRTGSTPGSSASGSRSLAFVLAAINLIMTVGRCGRPGWRGAGCRSSRSPRPSSPTCCSSPARSCSPALVMLFFDRHFDGVFFETGEGGGPMLYQHLTWIFFTAALRGDPRLRRRRDHRDRRHLLRASPPSRTARPWSRSPRSARSARSPGCRTCTRPTSGAACSTSAMFWALALAVPFGVLFFNWIGTLWNGAMRLRAPMLFALGAISTISFGLAGELAQSVIPVGWQLADTTAAGRTPTTRSSAAPCSAASRPSTTGSRR